MKNRNNMITTMILALGFLALPQGAQAVSPAPDGGYPGGNTAEGQSALLSLSSGTYNTGIGIFSLLSLTDGNFCTAVGAGTLLASTGSENTAMGAGALLSNTIGTDNTADGVFALFSNTEGHDNTGIGDFALFSNTTGINNVAVGRLALDNNITGNENTACGLFALQNNTGSGNTALGANAGNNLTTGANNIDIGLDVVGVAGESNTIRMGNNDITDAFIRGISGTTVASGDAVFVASNGHLGTITSSKRFKEDIKPMDKASEAILALRPVTFRYKKEIDPAGNSQFGLVAEDVEKVDTQLVTRDENGQVYSVRYDKVNAMLLNEFLKEHKKVAALEASVAALVSTVKEQASQIQKVNAQIDLQKSVTRTVADNQ
jgi:Chaperone of endosialidase